MAKLKTGRHTSPIKELRKTKRRTSHNRKIKKQIREIAKKVETAIANKKSDEANNLLAKCFSAWDKAAQFGIIHRNAAARKKARLSSKISKIAV
jgi:small subunit ribosomal protein S20